jgi:hypothetical protein
MGLRLRSLTGIGLAVGALAVLAAPAAADTTIGQTFTPAGGTPCVVNTAILQATDDGTPSYAVPADGVITSWSTKPDTITGTGQAKLKVYRLVSGTTWTVIGQSNVETLTSNIVNTFSTSIPVNAGDRIAILTTSGTFNCGAGGAPLANGVEFGDGTDHGVQTNEVFAAPITGFHVDLSAVVSPPPPPTSQGNPTSPINPAGHLRKRKCKKAKHHASAAKKKKCKKHKK